MIKDGKGNTRNNCDRQHGCLGLTSPIPLYQSLADRFGISFLGAGDEGFGIGDAFVFGLELGWDLGLKPMVLGGLLFDRCSGLELW